MVFRDGLNLKILPLIEKYINKPNTLIMNVMQVTADIFTNDMENIIKKYDPLYKRTYNILTMVDREWHVNNKKYLEDGIIKNMFAVRNRT